MRLLALASIALALTGCQTIPDDGTRATAQLQPTRGNKTFGEATFEQTGAKVRVVIYVQGLKPGQQYGLHIHEVGDCGNQAENAKGHFNPSGKPHGSPTSAERHAGDLPMLNADKRGRAKVQTDVDLITVDTGPSGIIGRSLIVHASPDDYRSQPSGNSGARIACGVIRAG